MFLLMSSLWAFLISDLLGFSMSHSFHLDLGALVVSIAATLLTRAAPAGTTRQPGLGARAPAASDSQPPPSPDVRGQSFVLWVSFV